ncbi:MAG: hypothetical protein S4CHLAM102_07010 [Chlamydiia bacterium]|nr:hypothetical protein [Chlamydiia bacterium]
MAGIVSASQAKGWDCAKDEVLGVLLPKVLEGADRKVLGRVAMVSHHFQQTALYEFKRTISLREVRVLWLPEGCNEPTVLRVVQQAEEVIVRSSEGEETSFSAVEQVFFGRDEGILETLSQIPADQMETLRGQTQREAIRYNLDQPVAPGEWRVREEGVYTHREHFSQIRVPDQISRVEGVYVQQATDLICTLFRSGFYMAGMKRLESLQSERFIEPKHLFNIGKSLIHVGRYGEFASFMHKIDQDRRNRLVFELLLALSDDYQFDHFEAFYNAVVQETGLSERHGIILRHLHLIKCLEAGEYQRALGVAKAILSGGERSVDAFKEATQLLYLLRRGNDAIKFLTEVCQIIESLEGKEGMNEADGLESLNCIRRWIETFRALNEPDEVAAAARVAGERRFATSVQHRHQDYGGHDWFFNSYPVTAYTGWYMNGRLYEGVPIQ